MTDRNQILLALLTKNELSSTLEVCFTNHISFFSGKHLSFTVYYQFIVFLDDEERAPLNLTSSLLLTVQNTTQSTVSASRNALTRQLSPPLSLLQSQNVSMDALPSRSSSTNARSPSISRCLRIGVCAMAKKASHHLLTRKPFQMIPKITNEFMSLL